MRKMKRSTDTPPWPQWPSCIQPKTLSFRCENNAAADVVFKTLNQSYLNSSSERESFSSSATTLMEEVEEEDGSGVAESIETVIRGLRSTERLFFEPGETSSLLGSGKETTSSSSGILGEKATSPRFKERSVVCAMVSNDPYLDFKKSMEEMVEAHGLLKDWDCLEELLCWYLKVNVKNNHGFIVGAFVDLLIGFSLTTTITTNSSSSSPMSYTCSSTNVATTTTCSSSSQS